MAKQFSNRESREAYWREQIAAWAGSGLNQREFCRQRSISLWSFRSWRTRLDGPRKHKGRRGNKPHFLPVQVTANATPVEVALRNGRILRVPCDLAPAAVGQLAAALEG